MTEKRYVITESKLRDFLCGVFRDELVDEFMEHLPLAPDLASLKADITKMSEETSLCGLNGGDAFKMAQVVERVKAFDWVLSLIDKMQKSGNNGKEGK